MNVDIILEGKLRESYFKDGVAEFKKRLSGYLSINIIETPNMSDYIQNIKTTDYVISMEIQGKMLSSIEFSEKLQEIEKDGFYNRIVFLIGGSNGLPSDAKTRSNFPFSMSKLTFLHQEAVLILIEQLYRAVKIMKNEPYHK